MALNWDENQRLVIEAPVSDRLIVEAGPGTGKTAVACARIGHLIDAQNVRPNKIWMVSFTRTAVAEFRNRISEYLQNKSFASIVKITTLDSSAWQLRQGFDAKSATKIFGGYDENIEAVTSLIEAGGEDLEEFFDEEIDHLIIDEAQDLVGLRKRLVKALISTVRSNCGVTVLADSAQAIYGFTNEAEDSPAEVDTATVVQDLQESSEFDFEVHELDQIHRTDSDQLRTIFSDGRSIALSSEGLPSEKVQELIALVKGNSHGSFDVTEVDQFKDRKDALILYRSRCEVLQASSRFLNDDVRHKLRISGMAPRLHPWLARAFHDHTNEFVEKGQFLNVWEKRVSVLYREHMPNWSADLAWSILRRNAADGDDRVNILRLRQLLSRSRPPDEFLVSDDELPGLTLGTIHASKGREAESVYLVLPQSWSSASFKDDGQADEEGRVAFVGITRSKEKLYFSEGPYSRSDNHFGRVFRLLKAQRYEKAQVHIGVAGDVDPDVDGRGALGSLELQDYLWGMAFEQREVKATSHPPTYRYALVIDEPSAPTILGALSQNVNHQLFGIANEIEKIRKTGSLKPPPEIHHLHCLGAATHVFDVNAEPLDRIPAPFNRSGFLLKPVVFGFPTIPFFKRRRSRSY